MRAGFARSLILLALAAMTAALYLNLHPALFAAVYSTTTALVLWGLLLIGREPASAGTGRRITAVSILFFLACLPSTPRLDDDLERYVWDGRVTWERGHPYGIAPSDWRLLHLRNGRFSSIGYRDVPTVYPPLAEAMFAVAAPFGAGAPWVLKFALFLAHLLLLWSLSSALRKRGRHPAWLGLYALSPLTFKEFANSGHIDLAGAAILFAALFQDTGPARRVLGIFAAALVKPLPLLVLPHALRHLGPRLRTAAFVGIGLIAAASLAFLIRRGSGMSDFLSLWTFFPLLARPVLAAGSALSFPNILVRAALWVPAVWVAATAFRRGLDPLCAWERIFLAWLLFSPVVNPWYAVWGLPSALILRRAYGPALLIALPLSYADAGAASPHLWNHGAAAVLIGVGLGIDFLQKKRNFSPLTGRFFSSSDGGFS